MTASKGIDEASDIFRRPGIKAIDIPSQIGRALSNHCQTSNQDKPDIRLDKAAQNSFKEKSRAPSIHGSMDCLFARASP
jgi:hypothetical protein